MRYLFLPEHGGPALGRMETVVERRWCTVLFVLLHPVLAWLDTGLVTDVEAPFVVLTTGLSLALLLSVGPLGGLVVGGMHVVSALVLQGAELEGELVAEAVVVAAVLTLAALVLESRFAVLGGPRTPRVVLETLFVAGLAAPAVLAVGTAAIHAVGPEPDVPSNLQLAQLAVAHGLGVLVVMPGARMLLKREPIVVSAGDAVVVAAGVVATAVLVGATALLAPDGVGELADDPVIVLPLLLVGFLVGSGSYSVTLLAVTLVATAVAALAYPDDGLELSIGLTAHASWWVVLGGGLLLAAEGDRRRRATLKLAALFGHAAAPSAEVSADGRIIQVNRAFAALLGWRPEELVDSDLLMLFASEDDGIGVESLVAGHRDEVRGQAHVRTRGGAQRLVRYVGRRLHDLGTGDGLVLVQLIDMTDEERRTVALERSNDALEQLGHRISHDLKQPLAAIAGYASTLRVHRDRLDHETVDEMLDRLDSAARRVVDQLDSMVQSASIGGDRAEAVPLVQVVEAVTGLVDIELREAGGTIATSLEVEAVHTDPRTLQQVLLNLVSNSLKYHDGALPPTVRIAARARGAGAEIAVIDNGPGIPHDALESVFEPGLRLAPTMAQGRGMGLADSRRAIEDMKGWLRAEPSAAGARFVLWLPDPELAKDVGPIRTVCVDLGDMAPGFRSGTATADEPVEIDHPRIAVLGRARTMSEAIELTSSHEPDVVFVDRWVADGDGLTALASLATAHPPARLVVRTRDGSQEAVRAALVSGATTAADAGADGRAMSELVTRVAG